MATNGIPEYTVPTVRRVSYVLPNVEHTVRFFAVPPASRATEQPDYQRTGPLTLEHSSSRPSGADRASSTEPHPRHALPVSSLAVDATTQIQDASSVSPQGILYTGGRDGMIGAWDLGIPMQRRRRHSKAHLSTLEDDYDEEATAGLLEDYGGGESADARSRQAPISAENRAGKGEWEMSLSSTARSATFRQCIGSHTDWVNDILLCNSNQTVVSASSDGNVNIWNPHDVHSSLTPQVLGTHKDYVRALAHASDVNWIASGSFDRTIKLWDVKELRHDPIITIAEASVHSSVYTIAANARGSIIAGGSPERIIRVWDPRSRQQVSQLIGHSDTVRKVIMSEDGSHILSASADSTIKLWSLAEQRCLHTFTHHTDSVWSLHSDHPQLDIFYSGDRSGVICKVDWERCSEVSEGECVVLAKETKYDAEAKFHSEASASGVHSIVALQNTYIWTANANGTVNRWRDVPSRTSREALYPIIAPVPSQARRRAAALASTFDTSTSLASNPRIDALRHTSSGGHISPSNRHADVLASSPPNGMGDRFSSESPSSVERYDEDLISSTALGLFGIPFDSLVCLEPPNDPYGVAIGLGSVSMRTPSRHAMNDGTDAIFSTASLVSIPSALQQYQQQHNHQGSYGPSNDTDKASPLMLQYASLTAASPQNAYSGNQIRSADATGARPSSVRSGSLRFAPTDTHHAYDDNGMGADDDDDNDADDGNEEGSKSAFEARMAFEERELAIDAKPLRARPEDVIYGSHGLIRSTLLNDRRHCLTIDSAGSIRLWDIIAGRSLGAFYWDEVVSAARENGISNELLPGEALDVVKERIQGYGSAPIWCTVDTKVGALSVHLEYPRCFDAEVYLDECEDAFRSSDAEFAYKDDQRVVAARLLFRSLFAGFCQRESQLRLGKSAPIPVGALAFERRTKLERIKTLANVGAGTPGMRTALAMSPSTPAIVSVSSPLLPTNTHLQSELHKFMIAQPPLAENEDGDGGGSTGGTGDYFSLQRATDASESVTSTPHARTDGVPGTPGGITSPGGTGFMGRLRMGLRRDGTQSKRGPKTPGAISAASPLISKTGGDVKLSNSVTDNIDGALADGETRQYLQALRSLLATFATPQQDSMMSSPPIGTPGESGPQPRRQSTTPTAADAVPMIAFHPQTALIISESSHGSGAYQTKYRGLVGNTQDDVISLELQSPFWLLEQLLNSGQNAALTAQRERDKLTFLLVPWEARGLSNSNGSASSSSGRDGGGGGGVDEQNNSVSSSPATMPSMPTGNSRLTATRMLRIKKACAYVADKLHLIDSSDEQYPVGTGSGLSSIVASRRGSSAAIEHAGGAQQSGVGQVPLANALHASSGGKGAQSSSPLKLRRPSAGSALSLPVNDAADGTWVMPVKAVPHEYVELLCKDEVVPPYMTLAQVQRYIWKSGAAIKLEYRWKSGVEREG